jgi:ribosomal protein S27AE
MPRKRTSSAPIIQPPPGFKQCRACGEVKELSCFGRWCRSSDGLMFQCRTCRSVWQKEAEGRKEYMAVYRRANRESINLNMKDYLVRNPEKKRARREAYLATLNGDLVRPTTCSRCGLLDDIQAHHDDYSRPLDVIWLCPRCHVTVGQEKKNARL